MDKTTLQNRLNTLLSQRAEASNQYTTLQANINAYNGAIEECRYWLQKVTEAESTPAPEEVTPVTDSVV